MRLLMLGSVGEWFSDCTRNITALVIEGSRLLCHNEKGTSDIPFDAAISPARQDHQDPPAANTDDRSTATTIGKADLDIVPSWST